MNKSKEFTKKDLKTGMQVTLRNGERLTVMLETPAGNFLASLIGKQYTLLSNYRENLTNSFDIQFDIIRVYKSENAYDYLGIFPPHNEIWSEENKIEITVNVNGKEVSPSKISKETWDNIRENN